MDRYNKVLPVGMATASYETDRIAIGGQVFDRVHPSLYTLGEQDAFKGWLSCRRVQQFGSHPV